MKSIAETPDRIKIVQEARRVIIKLGTAVLIREDGGIALSRFYSFVESIAALRKSGREVIVVSSGAVGLGAQRLGISTGPSGSIQLKQACAAVGQGRLMALYSDAFDRLGFPSAQILLTEDDFSNRKRYLNLRGTLNHLLELGAIPIINENDSVSTAEIEADDNQPYLKINFGDNDKLSALVASKMEADLLLILTDVEGLFDANPTQSDRANLIPVVPDITPAIEALAQDTGPYRKGVVSRGGIKTKIEAARIAAHSGCAVIVTSGKSSGVIDNIFSGQELGTLFLPKRSLPGKRRWIAFATTVKAAVVVNEGAKFALLDGKASLLAAGVVEVRGNFERGDVVSILDEADLEFARGIVNYSSREARKISGKHSNEIDRLVEDRNYDALITRDNIAFLGGADPHLETAPDTVENNSTK
jgi:glutamate 5-kinase